jgi:hypothetical protein
MQWLLAISMFFPFDWHVSRNYDMPPENYDIDEFDGMPWWGSFYLRAITPPTVLG